MKLGTSAWTGAALARAMVAGAGLALMAAPAVATPAAAAPTATAPAPASPAPASPAPVIPSADEMVTQAMQQMSSNPAEALRLATDADAAYHQEHDRDGRRHYCVSSEAALEALAQLAGFAANGSAQEADLVGPGWCGAQFLAGFALINLGRSAEAQPWLQRAAEMEPTNALYLSELAEWYKTARQWDEAGPLFERAEAAAQYAPAPIANAVRARAIRGQGFVAIERGDLDKAEAEFRRSQTIDPDSPAAQSELAYIASLRARAAAH